MKKIIPLITLFLGGVLGIVFTLGDYSFLTKDKEPFTPEFLNVHLFNTSKAVQPFELTDESEAVVDNSHLLNKWTIINFGYTSCPDICPTNLADASIMMRILNEEMNISNEIQSWFITIDPARDTTKVINDYTDAFHPDLIGLRASHKKINALALGFGFSYQLQMPIYDETQDEDDFMYWIAHSDMMVLINPQGQYAGYIAPPYDSQNMAMALNRMIEDYN